MTEIDEQISTILTERACIACVGFSANPERPSHYVSVFLKQRGKRIIPVNPGLAGQSFLGETVVGSLRDIPADIPVDMIDIFRKSEEIDGIVAEAIDALPHLRTVWMQLGLRNAEAAARATAAGLEVVQDRCPKIEVPRLGL